ncbi:glycine cleavage system protein GcvH [Kocuria soli]|uniref:glycine cleavage system protein GcvH n=1 Tax=Kocuria soli TaxID=2485125 RepID=UPI001431AC5C|nr:glycine cleavage system protein GcvH [Kocuria sp. JC486]
MSAIDKVNKDYRYSAEHEWVDSSTPAKVGLSQIAVDALGDVVYVDLPEAGTTVTAGEVCGEVESTKSVSEIYSPVTGTVVEANDAVVDDPAMLNSDPYGQAWLFTVEVESEGELLTPEEYAAAQDDED